MRLSRVLPAVPLALALLVGVPAGAQPAPVGEVAFANSGAEAAQPAFRRGLAQLHNFEYPAAIAAFREAQAADPDFVMAYWGEAMAYNHPVWMEQDRDAARAVLARLGPTREARLARVRDPRERAYLEAVEILYGEGTKEERDHLYSAAMASLHARWPNDVDGRAFYALSLLGLAHEGRDVGLYMRAAALLEEAFPTNRRHPGVLHYLIHSYDDPTHAPLGMRAALLYADVAPEAPHALHMTSHIFLALGMWDETVEVNARAMRVVNRDRAAKGQSSLHCGHYPEWRFYAELQRGRLVEADALLDACLTQARGDLAAGGAGSANRFEAPRSAVYSWSGMALRRLVETGEWPKQRLDIPAGGGWLGSRFAMAYGDALIARDAASARAARERIEALAEEARGAVPKGSADARYVEARLGVLLGQVRGLEASRAGRTEEGLELLRKAAEAETAMPVEFGPPAVEKPGWELLGDELLKAGRRDEARAAYRRALAAAPGRRLSLAGLKAAG